MALSEIVEVGRNFAVLVRVQGPDPKGVKMRNHAFHLYNSGQTTLSASGLRLPASFSLIDDTKSSAVVITVASVVEPFLSLQHRNVITQGKPELLPGVQIDVMVEGNKGSDDGNSHWLSAELLALADVSACSTAVRSLIQASISSSESWEVGWSLAVNSDDSQHLIDDTKTQVGIGWSTTKLAFLGVSETMWKDQIPNINISPSLKRGDLLLAIGSPFGALSPVHFFNSVSEGSVANSYPFGFGMTSLLMADIRCLPGMEGGPVFGKHASLVGILARPLRQRSSGAEVQLVIPWESIATACSTLLHEKPQSTHKERDLKHKDSNTAAKLNLSSAVDLGSLSPIEKAGRSVCLITIDDGVWASGVLLNKEGLILTNAHLLEPWRFQKASTNGDGNEGYKSNWTTMHRRIRVRLDHMDPWEWCDAKVVHVSKGPMDVSLLQLEFVPGQLSPIILDFTCPEPGSKVYVIGHGLFGPRSEFSPSASVGVVAKVVEAKGSLPYRTSRHGFALQHFPAMLQTTAAVHPGGSGGIVVNSCGHMIGLVTSNARHGGGKTIPHLNFSIPCAILEPIFRFSKDMSDLSLLEDLDSPNEQLSSVWALMPPLSPKPGPSLSNIPHPLLFDSNKDGKGSRFAKFIEGTQDLFAKQGQLGYNDRLSSGFAPSKL